MNAFGSLARQWLTVVLILMAIAVNGLSNVFPPAGKNVGEISNTTLGDVLITPAGYAFAIWGVIYLGLIGFGIYQALPAQRQKTAIARASRWIMAACCLQMLWIYCFLLSQFWLSVLLMVGIVFSLAKAYLCSRAARPTRANRWLLRAPISVYFGWIILATVLNVSGALLVSLPPGWDSAYAWSVIGTVVMMTISAGIIAIIALRYDDVALPGVAVWALCAIAVRQASWQPIAFLGIALSVGLIALMVKLTLPSRTS